MQKNALLPLTLLLSTAACGETAVGPPGSAGQAMIMSADHRALYVAAADRDAVLRRELATGDVTSTEVGREPSRLVAIGARVFVTLRAERKVAVLRDDGRTLSLETTIDVGAEPFGIAAAGDGAKIWVASSLSDRIDEIDVASLSIVRSFAVPNEPRWIAPHPSGKSLFVACVRAPSISTINLEDGSVRSVPLRSGGAIAARVRGDIAVTPNGERLLAPALFTTIPSLTPPEVPLGWDGKPIGSTQLLINPRVVVAEVDGDGAIDENAIDSVDITSALHGYPSSVTVSNDASFAAVSIEGSGEVAIMPLLSEAIKAGEVAGRVVKAGAGARAVVLSDDDRMYTWSFIDGTIVEHALNGASIDESERVVIAPSKDSDTIAIGRRLFYSTNDGYMQRKGARISCATCHFDGREDGLNWPTDLGARQAPSLAGPVSKTAPLRWEGTSASIAEDARNTSTGLMGGSGLRVVDAEAIQAFIDASRDVDVELKNAAQNAQVLRGKALFERADVGCWGCHNGERFTNGSIVTVFGHEQVKTRSLIGVAASAPYLRDGSIPTLRDVLLRATDGFMGRTSQLSSAELDDLEAYLQSL